MKTSYSRIGAYIGTGAGIVLFALFGLLPGSLIGGAAGLNMAGWLFGTPVEPGLIARVIVLVSMLMGVLVAGIAIVTATATLGWIIGRLLEPAKQPEAEKEGADHSAP